MRGLLVAVFAFWSTLAFAQVKVEMRPEKPSFLEGEPIYIVADITNIGEHPIGYGPVRYLLRGYRLPPGRHQIRVSGRAPVRWFTEGRVVVPSGQPQPPPIPRQSSDPVEGWDVDRIVPIVIEPATPERLRPILESARGRSIGGFQGSQELNAMYEMSPSLLAATIADMIEKRATFWYVSYESLADHNSAETRAHLRMMYDGTADLEVRSRIAQQLARTANVDNLEFFASLLPGRSTPKDDVIRSVALSALECLGASGDRIATALIAVLQGSNEYLRTESLRLLGRTRSRFAVTAIIAAAARDEHSFLSACTPLRMLTHYTWCDQRLPDVVAYLAQPKRWPRWWARNEGRVRIYGPNEAPPEGAVLPIVR